MKLRTHTLPTTLLFALFALQLGLECSLAYADADAPIASVTAVMAQQTAIEQAVEAFGSIGFAPSELQTVSLPYAAQVVRLRVVAGQSVRKNEFLFDAVADATTLSSYQQAQTALKLARGEMQRTKALLDQQLATQSQLAAAQKALSDADGAMTALQQQGVSPGAHPVAALRDAVVVTVAANQGDRLPAGSAILQLGALPKGGPAHVNLGIEPSQSALVRVGAPVRISLIENVSGNMAITWAGKVAAVGRAINPQTRLVDAIVNLDPGVTALPGSSVSARIEVSRQSHWIVPRSAVLHDADGEYVFQIVDGKAHRVGVSKRAENGDQYGVDGGIDGARKIVVTGNYELTDGMAVRESKK